MTPLAWFALGSWFGSAATAVAFYVGRWRGRRSVRPRVTLEYLGRPAGFMPQASGPLYRLHGWEDSEP